MRPSVRPVYALSVALVMTLVVSGCQKGWGPQSFTRTDGREVALTHRPQRIGLFASGSGSTLRDLGMADRVALAFVDDYDFPLPHATSVPADISRGGSPRALADYIVSQRLDFVILNRDVGEHSLVGVLDDVGIPVLCCEDDIRSLAGAGDWIRVLGRVTGREQRAANLVAEMNARVERVALRGETPRVFYVRSFGGPGSNLVATEPSMIGDLLKQVGAAPLPDATSPLQPMSGLPFYVDSSTMALLNPDCILVDGVSSARASLLPGWSDIPAVRRSDVFQVQANLDHAGPDLATLAEEIASALRQCQAS